MGEFTADFMETVERYIKEIVNNNLMNDNPQKIEL